MPEIPIVFKTKAELSGAQAVLSDLEKQIGKAKALGQDFSALEQQHASLQRSIASFGADEADGNENTGGRGKGLKSVVWNLKALKNQARDLPGVGQAITLLTNPITAVGVAAGFAISMWSKWRAELAERRETEQALSSLRDLGLGFRTLGSDSEEVAKQLEKTFEKITNDAKETAEGPDAFIKKIHEQAEEEKKLAKLQEDLAMAYLNIAYAKGEINDEELKRRQEIIKQESAGAQTAIAAEQRKASIAAKAEDAGYQGGKAHWYGTQAVYAGMESEIKKADLDEASKAAKTAAEIAEKKKTQHLGKMSITDAEERLTSLRFQLGQVDITGQGDPLKNAVERARLGSEIDRLSKGVSTASHYDAIAASAAEREKKVQKEYDAAVARQKEFGDTATKAKSDEEKRDQEVRDEIERNKMLSDVEGGQEEARKQISAAEVEKTRIEKENERSELERRREMEDAKRQNDLTRSLKGIISPERQDPVSKIQAEKVKTVVDMMLESARREYENAKRDNAPQAVLNDFARNISALEQLSVVNLQKFADTAIKQRSQWNDRLGNLIQALDKSIRDTDERMNRRLDQIEANMNSR